MSKTQSIQPLSHGRHGDMGWRRYGDYGFAASSALVPLSISEVSKAALSLPLAFARSDEAWQVMVVLGVNANQNLYVGPDGRWLGGYVPAALRSYPFRIGKAATSGEAVLCVDETSNLVSRSGSEPFFDEDGNLTAATKNIWSFMVEVMRGQTALSTAADKLVQSKIVVPWPIQLKDGDSERTIEGLYRADEAALAALDDKDFCSLRDAGILTLAYAQMFASGHIEKFGELLSIHAKHSQSQKASAPNQANSEPSTGRFSFGDSLDIDWSKFSDS